MSIKTIDGKDLFAILDHIVFEKSGIFLIRKDLDLLHSWIEGYKVGSNSKQIDSKNIDGLKDFSEFVGKKNKDEFENTFGWFGSIRAIYGGEQAGFDAFCNLYKEFRNLQHKKLNE